MATLSLPLHDNYTLHEPYSYRTLAAKNSPNPHELLRVVLKLGERLLVGGVKIGSATAAGIFAGKVRLFLGALQALKEVGNFISRTFFNKILVQTKILDRLAGQFDIVLSHIGQEGMQSVQALAKDILMIVADFIKSATTQTWVVGDVSLRSISGKSHIERRYLSPAQIYETFRPDQTMIIIRYKRPTGDHQLWLACDEYPFCLFICPCSGQNIDQICDGLDRHFRQTVYQLQPRSIPAFPNPLTAPVVTKSAKTADNFHNQVVDALYKIVQVGKKLLGLLAGDLGSISLIILLPIFRLFMAALSQFIDCYEEHPETIESIRARKRATALNRLINSIRDSEQKFKQDISDRHDRFMEDFRDIVFDQVEEAEDFLQDFR